MKKLLLVALLLLSTLTASAQDTFVVDYTSCVSFKDGVNQGWKDISITVVYNEKNTSDIVLYYGGGKTVRYKKTGSIIKEKTTANQDYQFVECIDTSDGLSVGIQYFESTETLRVIVQKGWYVEFHK
jgi:hypothetical protein